MSEYALNLEKGASVATTSKVGELALWQAGIIKPEFGVNDPLTHLEQYLEYGEAAIPSIDEDLITDIAERKLQPTFTNTVIFDRVGNDFVSRESQFSMTKMTAITEAKFAGDKTADLDLYKRAKIEAKEVSRLNQWFDTAKVGDVFIVESLPLGEERYTIVRLHQKAGLNELAEQVVTLHNATVDIFNQLHKELGASVAKSTTKLEVLDNMYAYRPDADNFDKVYISAFDKILEQQNPGQKFNFGLPTAEKENIEDDIRSVRLQTSLRAVYLYALRELRASKGLVTSEIIARSQSLGCSFSLAEGEAISIAIAEELLDRSLQSIVATFNRASKNELVALATNQDMASAADYVGHYGSKARAEGIRYEGACPPGTSRARMAEANTLAKAYRFNQDPSQCGTCPKCNKEYFVADDKFKNKILECNNCHAAIHFDGSSVSQAELDKYKKPGEGTLYGIIDQAIDSFREWNQKYDLEQAEKKQKKLAAARLNQQKAA